MFPAFRVFVIMDILLSQVVLVAIYWVTKYLISREIIGVVVAVEDISLF